MRYRGRLPAFRIAGSALVLFSLSPLGGEEWILDPVPRSTEYDSYAGEQLEPFDFVYGPVDKIKREVSYERVERIEGSVQYFTYEMSSAYKREDAIAWYREQLEQSEVAIEFECEGLDCGRATVWSISLFEQRVLSTVDAKQHYIAGLLERDEDRVLFSIYIVERGNRRVYAHVVQATTTDEVQLGSNLDFSSTLARHGHAVVETVVPDRNGRLTSDALDELRRLSVELEDFRNEDIYVICHVTGSRTADRLLEESNTCADSAVEALNESGEFEMVAFGAGPLFPLQGTPTSRLEVVIPRLLRREP